MKKLSCAILGATGVIGQHYVALLARHPWFEITFLAASEQSRGKAYEEVVQNRWSLSTPIPKGFILRSLEETANFDVVFSALPSALAQKYEPLYAARGAGVISSSPFHRSFHDIPVVIPEINPHHLNILPIQQKNRKWKKGFIVVKPNCAVQSFLLPLAPLHRSFTVKQISVTLLQAISGAGSKSLFSIYDNVIPYIEGEEEKCETEPQKILGNIEGDKIVPNSHFTLSAHCNRIPVLHGHLACVSVSFEKTPSFEDILAIWNQNTALQLPSAPLLPVIYRSHPQIRLNGNTEEGMCALTGRLRPCPLFDWRFVALSHNAIRGGAGGGILTGELLYQEGYFG